MLFCRKVNRMTKTNQKIPVGWSVDEFGKIAFLSKEKYIPSPNEHMKCLELEHLEKETGQLKGYIDSALQSSAKNRFKKGDVLYGKLRSYLKKYTLASFDGVCSTEIWVLRGWQEKLINIYLYLIIQTNKFNTACSVSTGTHMPRADWEYVSNIPFMYPPLPEQEKIAEILSCWDEGIEKLSALIEKKKLQKKALMQKLLTGKHRLKGFSTPWHEVRLGDICLLISGNAFSSDDFQVTGIPLIRISNIDGKNIILDEDTVYLPNDFLDKYSNFIIQPKDLLLAMSGATTGKMGVNKYFFPMLLNQRVCIIRANKTIQDFINQYLLQYNNKILKMSYGGAQPNIGSADIKKIKLYLPSSLAEQKAIADILSKADAEIELLNKKLAAFNLEKKAMMQKLLTGQIRVKVN